MKEAGRVMVDLKQRRIGAGLRQCGSVQWDRARDGRGLERPGASRACPSRDLPPLWGSLPGPSWSFTRQSVLHTVPGPDLGGVRREGPRSAPGDCAGPWDNPLECRTKKGGC